MNLFRYYSKVMRTLFAKFRGTRVAGKRAYTFDQNMSANESMNIPEIWKFVKFFQLEKLIEREEVKYMVRLLNQEKRENYGEMNSLNFQGFKALFVQIAQLIYSRPPRALPYLSLVEQLQHLIDTFRDITSFHGLSTKIYDNPAYSGSVNQEYIQHLQSEVANDPSFKLPKGFKKITQQAISFEYYIPDHFQIDESDRICYDIFGDVLDSVAGIEVIEPISVSKLTFRIKQTALGYRNLNSREGIRKQELTPIKPKKKRSQSNIFDDNRRKVKKPANTVGLNNLSIFFKRQLFKFDENDLETGVEAAGVLNSLLRRVSQAQQSNAIIKRKGSHHTEGNTKQTMNAVQEYKYNLEQKEKKKKLKRDKMLAKRAVKTRELYKQKKVERALKQEEKRKKEEEEAKQKKIKELKIRERQKKKQEIRKKQIAERKAELEIIKQTEEEAKKAKELQLKLKHLEQQNKFNEKQKAKMHENFKKIAEKRETEKKKKEEIIKKKQKKINENKKKVGQLLVKEKEKRLKKIKFEDRIFKLQRSTQIKEFFLKYEIQFNYIFDYYIKNVQTNISNNPFQTQLLQYKGFMIFVTQFNIYPRILNITEVKLIYRSITRDKSLTNNVPIGVNYDEFQQSLLRIAIKGQKIFNQINQNKYGQFIKDIVDSENQKQGRKVLTVKQENDLKDTTNYNENVISKDLDDDYSSFQNVSVNTLEGLITYLNIPDTKQELVNILVSFRTENKKVFHQQKKKPASQTKIKIDEIFQEERLKKWGKKKPVKKKKPLKIVDTREKVEIVNPIQNDVPVDGV